MHRETVLVAIGFVLAGAAAGVTGQNAIAPGHDRVPPYREPSPYISAADIQTALNALDQEAGGVADRRFHSRRSRQGAWSRQAPRERTAIRHHPYTHAGIHRGHQGDRHPGNRRKLDSANDRHRPVPEQRSERHYPKRRRRGRRAGAPRRTGRCHRQFARYAALAQSDRRNDRIRRDRSGQRRSRARHRAGGSPSFPPGRRPDIFRATGARRPARLLQSAPYENQPARCAEGCGGRPRSRRGERAAVAAADRHQRWRALV